MSASKYLAAALLVVASSAALVAGQTTPQFTGRTDAVLVDLAVTRNGVPADGLSAADFTVTDSGVAQKVQLVQAGSLPVSLLLAFDASASVRGQALDHLKDAAKAAVATLRPEDEAALLTFSHSVSLRVGWTSSRETLTKAIDSVSGQGLTALNDAAFAALALAGKPGTRRVILFFTDGDDTSSWTTAAAVLEAARRSNAVVYSVTLDAAGNSIASIGKLLEGRKSSDKFISELGQWMSAEPTLYRGALLPVLSIETGGEALRAADTAKLRTAFSDIVTRFSRRYVLAYTPAGVPAAGWHPIQVTVQGGGDVSVRAGYLR